MPSKLAPRDRIEVRVAQNCRHSTVDVHSRRPSRQIRLRHQTVRWVLQHRGSSESWFGSAQFAMSTRSWATDLSWNGVAYECFVCHATFRNLAGLNQHLQSPTHRAILFPLAETATTTKTRTSFRNIPRPAHACAAREERLPSPLSSASSAAEGSLLIRRMCELQQRGRALMLLPRYLHAWRREGEELVSLASSAWGLRRRFLAPGFRHGHHRGPYACHLVPLGVGYQKTRYWMTARWLLVEFWALVCRQEDLALHECERAPPPILS